MISNFTVPKEQKLFCVCVWTRQTYIRQTIWLKKHWSNNFSWFLSHLNFLFVAKKKRKKKFTYYYFWHDLSKCLCVYSFHFRNNVNIFRIVEQFFFFYSIFVLHRKWLEIDDKNRMTKTMDERLFNIQALKCTCIVIVTKKSPRSAYQTCLCIVNNFSKKNAFHMLELIDQNRFWLDL